MCFFDNFVWKKYGDVFEVFMLLWRFVFLFCEKGVEVRKGYCGNELDFVVGLWIIVVFVCFFMMYDVVYVCGYFI